MNYKSNYQTIIESNQFNEFLETAKVKEAEELKDAVREYYKRDVLSRRATLGHIENQFYGKKLGE